MRSSTAEAPRRVSSPAGWHVENEASYRVVWTGWEPRVSPSVPIGLAGNAAPERKLRVMFVDHVARLSGGEIAMLRVLPALSRSVDVGVVCGEEGHLVAKLAEAGISATVLPLAPRLRDLRKDTVSPPSLAVTSLASLPRYVALLARMIRRSQVDIVHTNSLKAALYGGAAGRIAGVPVVWHIRDRIATDYLPGSAVALVRGSSLVLPTAVIANSRTTLSTLPRRWREAATYCPVVPDAIEIDQAVVRRPPAAELDHDRHGRKARSLEGSACISRRVRRSVSWDGGSCSNHWQRDVRGRGVREHPASAGRETRS